jgi:hypothetical protein
MNILERLDCSMPAHTPVTPPMPIRMLAVPLFVCTTTLILGVVMLLNGNVAWGLFWIIGSVILAAANYMFRRNAWQSSMSKRSGRPTLRVARKTEEVLLKKNLRHDLSGRQAA